MGLTYGAVFALYQVGFSFPQLIPPGQELFVFFIDLGALCGAVSALAILFETGKRRAQTQLTEAKEEAEQAARLKQTLLANMSHEIRTPLSSIIGFAELIEESPESAPKFIPHITTSGNRLLRTLNSILELSQLEAGEWDGNREAVDLDAVAAETARMLGPQAREKGLEFAVRATNGHLPALAEPKATRRIAQNLTHNAIKFTDEGRVLLETGTDQGTPYLRVRDTGIGMSEEVQNEVLEAFTQASEGLGRRYEGTGLGLTITSRLASLLDAELRIESNEGEGTDVLVRFPTAESAKADAER